MIEDEIVLGKEIDPETFRIDMASELCTALAALDAPRELLEIVGSWGDTMDDDETLRHLRSYNQSGTFYSKIICQS
ncbi:hypothetical protein [Mesorhizobium sp. WSM2239]|uniref:Uncharacterized protein n=2 Tax=unclassified Mesorhizobium TaxID=325217 RepID=A0AAU8DGG5_9HYPH